MHLAACEESAVDPPDTPRRSALKVQPSDSQRSPDSLPSPQPRRSVPRDQPASAVPGGCQLRAHIRKACPQKLISPTWAGVLILSFNVRVSYDFLSELLPMEVY